jgi:tetratricopeptide (TPR) repeat protein
MVVGACVVNLAGSTGPRSARQMWSTEERRPKWRRIKAYQLAGAATVGFLGVSGVVSVGNLVSVINRLRHAAETWFRPARRPPEEESPAERAMAHYRAGVASYQSRKFQQAVREFTKAISLAPGHAGMYQHRGAALAELGRLAQAINDYDRAIHLNPTFPDTYLDRGNAHHAQGRHEMAIRDYTEAIRLRPAYPEAYANRSAIFLEMGNEDAAEADAVQAKDLGIDPTALDALLKAARASGRRRKPRR